MSFLQESSPPPGNVKTGVIFFFFWSVKTIRWHVIVFQSYFLARGSARSFCTRPSRKELALALIISPCPSGLYTYNISELERTSGRLVQTFVPIRRLRPSEGTSSADSPVGHKQVWNPGLPAAMLLPTRCSVVCEFSWSSASLECLWKIQVVGLWSRNSSVCKAARDSDGVTPFLSATVWDPYPCSDGAGAGRADSSVCPQ